MMNQFSRAAFGGVFASGIFAGLSNNSAHNSSTAQTIQSLDDRVAAIEGDLGLGNKVGLDNFPSFNAKCKSCTRNRLTPELYLKYCNLKSKETGYTLDQIIQPTLDSVGLGMGSIAGDEDCYHTFRGWFDEVVDAWHGYKPDQKHALDIDFTKLKFSPEQQKKFDEHVISTRIRAGRSIRGLPLPPATNRAQRRKVEELVSGGLNTMTGELSGTYYPLNGMTAAQEQQLIDDHFLFQKPNAINVVGVSGGARDWPDARGIFHNDAKTFLVWVNEEDHMRCISMQKGGDVKEVFARWSKAIVAVEAAIKEQGYEYMYDDHFGNICACPSNLGTGLRASVMLKLPKLYKKLGVHKLEELCLSMDLQARGGKGEHSPPGPGGSFDISNVQRIGFSEVQLIQKMIDGVTKLIAMEEEL